MFRCCGGQPKWLTLRVDTRGHILIYALEQNFPMDFLMIISISNMTMALAQHLNCV